MDPELTELAVSGEPKPPGIQDALSDIETDSAGKLRSQSVHTSQPAGDGELQDALRQTVVIIPARNEESSIGAVLEDLPSVGGVIVVDNGSTDRTSEIAATAGAMVVREERPGYGQACLAGLAHLEDQLPTLEFSPTYVAFLDGDYSDYPEYLEQLVAPLHAGDYDFVLGSRLLGEREAGAMPPQAIWGNQLATFLIRLFWGYRYTDLGPFRIIHRDCLNELKMQDTNFGWTVEMQIKAIVSKLRITEIPVPYRCRIGKSKISGTISGTVRAGWKILYTIGKYRWLTRNGIHKAN